eukprot:NODE_1304_length_628_cov_558.309154_g1024_i0.p1 GENE.NODE_1304_length_628_cov_558.309154_g1024_i0~~NODE_1304_length_628_cov_558.309154_g1024_i0.p1  ORF type:complete len:153 (+),score=10.03 NODE_1304_length_628_cov_558.309154_g1024_i0:50-508(+)
MCNDIIGCLQGGYLERYNACMGLPPPAQDRDFVQPMLPRAHSDDEYIAAPEAARPPSVPPLPVNQVAKPHTSSPTTSGIVSPIRFPSTIESSGPAPPPQAFCPSCHQPLPAGASSCQQCSAFLHRVRHCDNCNHAIDSDDRFCGECGHGSHA